MNDKEKQQNNPMNNISTDEVCQIIGRLYVQLWTASNQLSEVSKSLAESHARNHQLENLLNKQNLEGLFNKDQHKAKGNQVKDGQE